MKKIALHVRRGAMAYLKQQYKVVIIVFLVLAIVFAVMAYFNLQNGWVPFAFLTGGFFSGLAGFFGMKTATYASARTANAARHSLNSGLQVAFRSGASMRRTSIRISSPRRDSILVTKNPTTRAASTAKRGRKFQVSPLTIEKIAIAAGRTMATRKEARRNWRRWRSDLPASTARHDDVSLRGGTVEYTACLCSVLSAYPLVASIRQLRRPRSPYRESSGDRRPSNILSRWSRRSCRRVSPPWCRSAL